MTEVISKLEMMPEYLSSAQLVALGLFPTPDSVYIARLRGNSPDYCKLGRKVLYPKESVRQFIEARMRKGDIPKACNGKEEAIPVVHI